MKIENNILCEVKDADIVDGSFVIPDSVTNIGKWAFDGCTNLSSLVIPNSVTSIGEWAFCSCTSLASIVIPDGVTSIGGYAFNGCTNLSSLVIPNSVTSIGYGAFYGCKSLTSITIQGKDYNTTCADGYIIFVGQHRNISDSIEISKGEQFENMIAGKLNTITCWIAKKGDTYAHGETMKQTISDLHFKLSSERGKDQYLNLTLDSVLTFDEAKTAYRIITGACQFGTEQFVKSLKQVKDKYTVSDMIAITDGQYGHNLFANFVSGSIR